MQFAAFQILREKRKPNITSSGVPGQETIPATMTGDGTAGDLTRSVASAMPMELGTTNALVFGPLEREKNKTLTSYIVLDAQRDVGRQGNRPDTGPTLTDKHTFSTTVRSQKPVIAPKCNLFKGSFRLLGTHYFLRGNHLYYFSYFAIFSLLFQKLLAVLVKTPQVLRIVSILVVWRSNAWRSCSFSSVADFVERTMISKEIIY